jgi:quinoprotein glucose dehydrogenase
MRIALLLLAALAPQQDDDYKPEIHEPTGEGEAHIQAMQVPDGFKVELWAEEPMLANPVCLYVTRKGDCYLGETFRHTHGVLDMREHRDWLEIDIGATTVEDRVEMMKLASPEQFEQWGKEHDQIRLIRDTDQDGKADEAIVFGAKFDGPAAGIGAGLLEHEGDVYWTCIPELWRLKDTDGDGVADEREALHTGFGVHVALLGHDLHGLRIGPDGRLYFSCGDRGFNVQTPDGIVRNTKSGSVLRCELDGSNLELVHNGLRNPQELVFDQWGNLFTGDNNSDSIDRARWVQIHPGGENGWRYSFQWMNGGNGRGQRGSWNEEKLWFPHFEGQAGYLTPPIAWLASGPSGLAYDPGVGLPADHANHFFLVDFRGGRSYSGVHAFDLKRKGAGYELGEVTPFVWNCLPVDGDFGPDGAYWFCDWVGGWQKTGRGRIYRMYHEDAVNTDAAKQAQTILAEGFRGRGASELGDLLAHPHKDVRLFAQLELASRPNEGQPDLAEAALDGTTVLERIHGIWGVGIGARRHGWDASGLVGLVEDSNPEIRAQTIRTLADCGAQLSAPTVRRLIIDPDERVRYHALLAAAKLGFEEATDEIVMQLEMTRESDPVMRHAAIEAMVTCIPDLGFYAEHISVDVRVAAVVAMRRRAERGGAGVGENLRPFLEDEHPRVALEAARALYEFGGAKGLEMVSIQVPAWNDSDLTGDIVDGPGRGYLTPFMRRVLSANERGGSAHDARRIASIVRMGAFEESLRLDGMRMFRTWADAPNLDYVDGHFRDLPERDASFIPEIVQHMADDEHVDWSDALWKAWIETAAKLGIEEAHARFETLVRSADHSGAVRAAALNALLSTDFADKFAVVQFALGDNDTTLRAAAFPRLAKLAPEEMQALLPGLLQDGEITEQRAALTALGQVAQPWASGELVRQIMSTSRGLFPAELILDLVRASETNGTDTVKAALSMLIAPSMEDEAVAKYLPSLLGGDLEEGRKIFEHADLDCLRCHGNADSTGPRIGPDLAGLGGRATRLRILESIVDPNRRIDPDFQNEAFFLIDDTIVVGRVMGTKDGFLQVMNAQGETTEVHEDDVRDRKPDLSAMPTDLAPKLTRREMRHLIEYLANR